MTLSIKGIFETLSTKGIFETLSINDTQHNALSITAQVPLC